MADIDRKNDKPKRDRAKLLLGLARGLSARAAAKQSGYGERQARRIAADEATQKEVQKLRDALMRRALALLVGVQARAIHTLKQLLGAQSEAVKLGACRTLLEEVLRFRDQLDLSDRIAAHEARLVEVEAALDKQPPSWGATSPPDDEPADPPPAASTCR